MPLRCALPQFPLRATAVAALALVSSLPALAQTAAPTNAGEVVVTARRIGERLQDVPVSVQALTGGDLSARGIGSISELSLYTPGLSYSADFGRTQERPVIRGISALRPEAPQPVSVFIDGVYVRDATLGLALDDALRVEVIKGPQSALYGRSTYSGAINYVTVKPGNTVSGRAYATIGSDGERQVFAAVTAPIKPDELSLRFRVKRYEFGGQYTNELSGRKIGNELSNAAGVSANLIASPSFSAALAMDYSEDRDGLFAATARTVPVVNAQGVVTNPNGTTNVANGSVCDGKTINIVGNNPVTGLPDATVPAPATTRGNGWPCGASTFTGTVVRRNEADLANYTDPATGANYGNIAGLERRILRGALTLTWDFWGGHTLVSQTARTQQTANLGADQSYNGTRFAITRASWLSYNRDRLDYNSQEFRLSSPLDRPLTWQAGLFYYEENTSGTATGVIALNAQNAVVPDAMRPSSATSTRNTAPFGRIQYDAGVWRASFEGRYSEERVRVGGTPLGTAVVNAGTCTAGQPCVINGDRSFNDFAPRLTLDWRPSRTLMVYGQAARGSKAGGFNTAAGVAPAQFAYEGEKVKAYELGVKATPMPGLIANVALFRNDIDGLQLSNLAAIVNPLTGASTTTTIVNNVGKARTQGLEAELSGRPMPWLNAGLIYAFTDAKALQGTEVTNGTVFGGNQSVAGFTLPRSPKHSASAWAAVETAVGAGLTGFGRVDVTYQSRRYAEIQNLIWADPFTRVNLSAGVRSTQGWKVNAWVKNATNNDSSLNGFRYLDAGNFRRSAVDFLPRLRSFGVTTSIDF